MAWTWNDPERSPHPRLKEAALDVITKVRVMLENKRAIIEFMLGVEAMMGLTDYHKGHVSSMHQTIADLEAMLGGKWVVTESRLIDAWNGADGQERRPGEGEMGFTLSWTAIGVGDGETSFYMGKDGLIHCDNESMNRDFFAQVLAKFLEGVKMDHQESPDPGA
jgi:hypothetical protein